MSDVKSFSYKKRFNMYLKLARKDSRIWTREHHYIRIFTNIFMVNFTLTVLYNLYYSSNIGSYANLRKTNFKTSRS